MVRRIAATVVLVLFGLGLGAALGEAFLRMAGWPAPGFYIDGKGPVHPVEPGKHGASYPPLVNGRMRHYDYDVSWQTNDHGFRERRLVPKAPSAWRIGLLGDSFASGMGVEPPETFVAQWIREVGRSLAPEGRRAELWNLATPAAGTAHEADVLEGAGVRYDLDSIVVAFYAGNDLQDNVIWQKRRDGVTSAERPAGLWRVWLREHSRLATFVWINSLRALATFEPPGAFRPEPIAEAWPVTERSLDRILALAHGRPVSVWYLPSPPEWDDDVWREVKQRYRVPDENRGLVRARVQAWGDQRRVSVVDFTPFLRSCPSMRECAFKVDNHWNVRGHALAAAGLIARYRSRGDRPGQMAGTTAASP